MNIQVNFMLREFYDHFQIGGVSVKEVYTHPWGNEKIFATWFQTQTLCKAVIWAFF